MLSTTDGGSEDSSGDAEREAVLYLLKNGEINDIECALAYMRQELLDNPDVIRMGTREYFQLFCSGAKFASVEDKVLVGSILDRFTRIRDPLPNFHEAFKKLNSESGEINRGSIYMDLGSRCLVSGSFFKKRLNKWNLANFYNNVGPNSFRSIGYNSLAETFNDWTNYISENVLAA